MYLESKGLTKEDVLKWSYKYNNLKCNVRLRGVECLLTFEDYIDLVVEANISNPDQIGHSIDSYHLGRIGDEGDYTIGNCRFILHEQNLIEQKINGGTESMIDKLTGRRKDTHDHVYRSSIKKKRSYYLISPEGRTYTGDNLTAFCREHDLNRKYMRELCDGKRSSYKGWTGSCTYIEGGPIGR